MKGPQKENGYTAIANEIMDALSKIRIPGQARQVLDFILRKTYGWHKKKAEISLADFVSGTGLSKVAICKSLNKLLDMNLITKLGNAKSHFTKLGNDYAVTYGFQKQYKLWNTLPKKVTSALRYPKRKSTLPKKVTPPLITKEIKKEKIKRIFNQKEFDLFYSAYPKKTGKKEVLNRWKKLIKSSELPKLEIILEAIKKQTDWRKNAKGEFRPEWKNPATWLNKGCWEDEIEKTKEDNDPYEGRL